MVSIVIISTGQGSSQSIQGAILYLQETPSTNYTQEIPLQSEHLQCSYQGGLLTELNIGLAKGLFSAVCTVA